VPRSVQRAVRFIILGIVDTACMFADKRVVVRKTKNDLAHHQQKAEAPKTSPKGDEPYDAIEILCAYKWGIKSNAD
jgi:hypothetical protein